MGPSCEWINFIKKPFPFPAVVISPYDYQENFALVVTQRRCNWQEIRFFGILIFLNWYRDPSRIFWVVVNRHQAPRHSFTIRASLTTRHINSVVFTMAQFNREGPCRTGGIFRFAAHISWHRDHAHTHQPWRYVSKGFFAYYCISQRTRFSVSKPF